MPITATKTETQSWITKDVANEETLNVSLTWLIVNSPLSPVAKLVNKTITCEHWINDNGTKEAKLEVIKLHDDKEVCEIQSGKKICRKESLILVKSTIEVYQAEGPDGRRPGPLLRTRDNGQRLFGVKSDEYEKTEE